MNATSTREDYFYSHGNGESLNWRDIFSGWVVALVCVTGLMLVV